MFLAPGLHPHLSGMLGGGPIHLGSQGPSPKRVRGQVIATEAILVTKPLQPSRATGRAGRLPRAVPFYFFFVIFFTLHMPHTELAQWGPKTVS